MVLENKLGLSTSSELANAEEKISKNEGIIGIIVQLVWIIILVSMGYLLMKKALKAIRDGDAAIIWDFPE